MRIPRVIRAQPVGAADPVDVRVVTGLSVEDAHARFQRLARDELDRSYRLAGLILGDAGEAEDAVQDALLRAWRSVASLRDADGFGAWFDRILVNGCRDRLRRRRTIQFVPLDPTLDPAGEADPFRALAERDSLVAALRVLEPDERVVVVLHYWADLSLQDIADRTGSPIGTVKSRLHRARGALRRHLDADPGVRT